MSKVTIRESTYDYNKLGPAFFELMDSIGGHLIKRGDRVLIKPNLLSPASPHQAVLTHPYVVKAAVEYALQKGALPLVSDSPAIGSFEKILRLSGIKDALNGLDVTCRAFENSIKVDVGEPFNAIDIAEDAMKADVIINLPKLKTHSQMLLTLGVKNLFGCVVGYRKPEWHMRAGINRAMFAKLLVLIYERVRPSFTILDGILAMEGEGPGASGIPREIGVLIGSQDAYAVDSIVCRMIGLEPDRLLTLNTAKEMGFIEESNEVNGHLPEISDFKLPNMGTLMFGPKILHGFIRRHLLQRPVCDDGSCRMCGECWQICPERAISPHEKALYFDYDRCIRCYCCIEVCPYGVLHTGETFAGKIIREVIKRYS
jgi:uncharacterized protein (DUF362 family)/Pyruvate/2-oxoacid:ferredoxin oxidoreductase delta subunit